MKLIIQIPCFNESDTLGVTLQAIPKSIPGFEIVELLIIDDGSIDDTIGVARAHGVHHIVRHTGNQGLARAFMTGIDACLKLGADVIVNTDADNQYNAADIHLLTDPILKSQADIVVGARPIETVEHFSAIKKALQTLGSWVVRIVSGTQVTDAPSGFRAFSREAAQRLVVFNSYTYTLETIIQAGTKSMVIASVPVRVNSALRPSRLVKSTPYYLRRSILTVIRIFVVYRPFLFFGVIAFALLSSGTFLGMRFVYKFLTGDGQGNIQSLILASVLLITGFQTILVAFLADLMAANRNLLEDTRYRLTKLGEYAAANNRAAETKSLPPKAENHIPHIDHVEQAKAQNE